MSKAAVFALLFRYFTVLQPAGTTERARLTRWLGSSGAVPGDAGAWLNAVEGETVAALEDLGEATASDLVARVPGLRVQIPFGEGRTWQGTVGVSTRILFLLAAEGRVIRGRPRGSVVSSLYRWAPMDRWVPGGLPSMPTDEARAGLVRRWLGAYVPPEEEEAAPPEEPWAALLPSLDPTVMGWARRDWFLGPHRAALFDRNGNAGPTAWWNGRVVGGWAQRPDGEVVVRLLEDPGEEAARGGARWGAPGLRGRSRVGATSACREARQRAPGLSGRSRG